MKRYNTKTRAAVETAMQTAGRPLSVRELMEATGATRPTINAIIQRLASEGRVCEVHGVGIPPCYALQDGAHGPLLYQAGESLYWTPPNGFRASYTVEVTVGEVVGYNESTGEYHGDPLWNKNRDDEPTNADDKFSKWLGRLSTDPSPRLLDVDTKVFHDTNEVEKEAN